MARPIVPQSVAPRDVLHPDGPVPLGWRRTRSGKVKRRNIVWRVRRFLVAGVALCVLAASGVGASFWSSVAVPTGTSKPQPSYLCDATVLVGCGRDSAFAEVSVPDAGEPARFDEIPEVMVRALVAAEDKEFFSHRGVAATGIARAIWHDVRSDSNARQGGSTLTQQLIKVLSHDDSPTVSRKAKEAIQAMKMEQTLPKSEILTLYFNSVYFGRNATGIVAAVRAYFGPDKKVKDIGLREAAYLAAVIREPEQVDANLAPTDSKRERQRTYATGRRKDVLNTMLEQGYITQVERDEVAEMDWDYVVQDDQSSRSKMFKGYEKIGGYQWSDYVLSWITHNTPITAQQLKENGLRIYTTMDPLLQTMATNAVAEVLPTPSEHETGLASLDERGYLKAMVGSRNARSLGTNFALGTEEGRQVGSTFKAVVLANYLMQPGKTLDDKFDSVKELKVTPNDPPLRLGHNEAEELGIDLTHALAISSNTALGAVLNTTSKLDSAGSNASVIELAKKMGMPDSAFETNAETKRQATYSPSLAIGGPVHSSPLSVAYLYLTLANKGERIGTVPSPVLKITDPSGTPLWQSEPTRTQAIPRPVAEQVDYALTRVIDDDEGTGHKEAGVPGQVVAGKTGTVALDIKNSKVDVNSDAWFSGFTCTLTTSVWFGNPQGPLAIGTVEGVDNVNGGTLPARIFSRYMTLATAKQPRCPYDRPPGSFATTTVPPATAAPSTKERPTTTEDEDDRRRRDRDETSTTRRFGLPTFTLPSTTDRDDRTTTTRRLGPSGPTTTADTVRPRPGQPNGGQP
jgi:membrane peptidoglycan carboxypeptidase